MPSSFQATSGTGTQVQRLVRCERGRDASVVGTSSWADPGFVKEWYPPKMAARERLPWYAERFEYVELNSSFYAVPDRNTVHKWVEETPDGFVFDVKAHRLLSRHSAAARVAAAGAARAGARSTGRGRVQLTPELETALGAPARGGDRAARRGGQARRLPGPADAGVRARQARAGRARRPGRGARSRTAWPSSCATAAGCATSGARRRWAGSPSTGVAFVGVDAPPGRPLLDHALGLRRRHPRRARLPAPARPQHRRLPEGQVGGRALRAGATRTRSWRRSPARAQALAEQARRGARGLQQQPRRRRPHGGSALPRAAGPGARRARSSCGSRRGAARTRRASRRRSGSRPSGARAARRGTAPSRSRPCPAPGVEAGSKPGPSSVTSVRTAERPTSILRTTVSDCACLTLFETSSVTSRRSVSISGGSMSARSLDSARRARAAASGPPRRRRLKPSSTLLALRAHEPQRPDVS